MIGMAIDSTRLFIAGKLFRDPRVVFRQLAIGAGCGAIVMVILGQFLPLWVAAAVGGMLAGFLQPVLFKDLKYA